MRLLVVLWAVLACLLGCATVLHAGHQPLSRIAMERATAALDDSASINAHPTVLGLKVQLLLPSLGPFSSSVSLPLGTGNVLATDHACLGSVSVLYGHLVVFQGQSSDWVVVEFSHPNPSNDDWVGVFSPSGFRWALQLMTISSCGLSSDTDISSVHMVSSEICQPENWMDQPPYLCTAPIKVISIQYYMLFPLTAKLVPYMT